MVSMKIKLFSFIHYHIKLPIRPMVVYILTGRSIIYYHNQNMICLSMGYICSLFLTYNFLCVLQCFGIFDLVHFRYRAKVNNEIIMNIKLTIWLYPVFLRFTYGIRRKSRLQGSNRISMLKIKVTRKAYSGAEKMGTELICKMREGFKISEIVL